MKISYFIFLLLITSFKTVSFAQGSLDTSDAKFISMPDFELSPEAKTAGIDGKLIVSLTVGTDGKASNIRTFGSPMWPCGKDPKNKLIEDVRDAVKQHLLSAKFEAATKEGKPKSSDVQIIFFLSDTFKKANDVKQIEENLKKGVNPPLVDVRNIHLRAITLPKQLMRSGNLLSYKTTEMQILVDENGDVVSAGGLRSGQMELREARKLVCDAKFKPLVLNQKPVKMTGMVVYGLY